MPDTPIWSTNIRLLESVGVDDDNTLYAESKSALDEYLLSKTKFIGDEYSFIRPDSQTKNAYNTGCVHVALPYDSTSLCDYVAFQNTDVSDRWMYGRVTNREYVNVNSTRLYFQLDYWLTFYDELSAGLGACMIIRTHVKRAEEWVGGENGTRPTYNWLGPEPYNPELFEWSYSTADYLLDQLNDWLYPNASLVVATTLQNGSDPLGSYTINGEPALRCAFKFSSLNGGFLWVQSYILTGSADSLVSFSLVPDATTVNYTLFGGYEEDPYPVYREDSFVMPNRAQTFIQRSDGLAVQNAKLYTAPYCYVTIYSMADSYTMAPQDFADINGEFYTRTLLTGTETVTATTYIYKPDKTGESSIPYVALKLPPYPTISAYESTWANYIQENLIKDAITLYNSSQTLNSPTALVNQSDTSMIQSQQKQAEDNILNVIDRNYRAYTSANPVVGKNDRNSDALYVAHLFKYYLTVSTPSPQDVTRLDNYLTRYGYTQRTYAVPDLCVRQYFTYLQCESVTLSAPIPSEGIDQVKRMLLSGVTFWNCAETDIGVEHLENPDS